VFIICTEQHLDSYVAGLTEKVRTLDR